MITKLKLYKMSFTRVFYSQHTSNKKYLWYYYISKITLDRDHSRLVVITRTIVVSYLQGISYYLGQHEHNYK